MFSTSRIVFEVMSLVAIAIMSGCKPSLDDLTVWKEVFPSPDGSIVAVAYTIQNGGFGSANIETIVDLKQLGSGSGTTVLGLDCDGPMPRPYTLDNIANRGGSVDLTVHWIDATHLQLNYSNHPRVESISKDAYGVSISSVEEK